jgi:sulfatase modifying factor 1
LDLDGDGYSTCDGDCDDADATLELDDVDGDGYSTCDGDCNDSNINMEPSDMDGDGYSTCDGDCDDNDASVESLDRDGDGYSTCDGDCVDGDAAVLLCPITHPGGGDMIYISAGTFDMGCTAAQSADGNCASDESPVHTVTLTHDFYMGETEVTQGEYQSITGTNPSYFSSCGTDCPVEYISWHEVAEYANALSVADGLTECFTCTNGFCTTPNSPYTCDGYRLPTEAEWEYAARAGTDYVYAGSNTVGDVAWYYSNASSTTHPVAQTLPNDWGLYDMSGNVWEWIWDWYDSGYYSSSPSSDPAGPTSASDRVVRGGSWYDVASNARVAGRSSPPFGRYDIGFRLSRTVNP